MTGIELDKDVAQIAQKWSKRYRGIEILSRDVREIFPTEGTIYYLFNPFSSSVLEDFLKLAEKNVY